MSIHIRNSVQNESCSIKSEISTLKYFKITGIILAVLGLLSLVLGIIFIAYTGFLEWFSLIGLSPFIIGFSIFLLYCSYKHPYYSYKYPSTPVNLTETTRTFSKKAVLDYFNENFLPTQKSSYSQDVIYLPDLSLKKLHIHSVPNSKLRIHSFEGELTIPPFYTTTRPYLIIWNPSDNEVSPRKIAVNKLLSSSVTAESWISSKPGNSILRKGQISIGNWESSSEHRNKLSNFSPPFPYNWNFLGQISLPTPQEDGDNIHSAFNLAKKAFYSAILESYRFACDIIAFPVPLCDRNQSSEEWSAMLSTALLEAIIDSVPYSPKQETATHILLINPNPHPSHKLSISNKSNNYYKK